MTTPCCTTPRCPPFRRSSPRTSSPPSGSCSTRTAAARRHCSTRGAEGWDGIVAPIERMHHRLARTWSPVGHLNGVDERRRTAGGLQRLPAAAHRVPHRARAERALCAPPTSACTDTRGRRLRPGAAQAASRTRCATSVLPASRCPPIASSASARSWSACDGAGEVRRERARRHQRLVARRRGRGRTRRPARDDGQRPRARRSRRRTASSGWLFTLDAPNYQAVMTHAEKRAAAPRVLRGLDHARLGAGSARRAVGQHAR